MPKQVSRQPATAAPCRDKGSPSGRDAPAWCPGAPVRGADCAPGHLQPCDAVLGRARIDLPEMSASAGATRPRAPVPGSGLLPGGPMPRHVAIIMDGNRRWAADAGMATVRAGHVAGQRAAATAVLTLALAFQPGFAAEPRGVM